MGFLQNSWLRYFDRTYQQIKAQVFTDLAIFTPEITDNTESNPFVKAVGIYSGIAEMLGYYIDNAAREAFIDSCRRYESAVKIAKLMDYRIMGRSAATVDVTFVLNAVYGANIVIPVNTVISTSDNILFYTVAPLTIIAGNIEGTVSARQAEFVTNQTIGISNGQAGQSFIIGTDVMEGSVAIEINLINWSSVETFAYSLPAAQVFVPTVDEAQNVIVNLGDGQSGAIPVNGLSVIADFQITKGNDGNVAAFAINTIVTNLVLPIDVTLNIENRERASGGSGVESLQDLKKRVPLYLRTIRRAVTRQDYIDVAEQVAGVVKAGIIFNCGKTVDVYIVPTGGGIASNILLASVVTWFEDKRMVTTRVQALAAGEVHVILDIDIQVLPQFQQALVTQDVMNNLTNFLSYANQTINGIVQLSDIYEIVETTQGVQNSQINIMTSRPYARPLAQTTPQLNWTRSTLAASNVTNVWRITMINPTTYQLIKNGNFVGTFNVGVLVNQPEISFTVTAGVYILGYSWEFLTYRYFGTLDLQEPSLPISLVGDITLNPSGGV
jgi:hypothetical protein